MVNKTTSGQLFVKYPQYTEESTEGTTPTTATFTSCGLVQSLSLNIDGNYVDISLLGQEDLIAILQGQNVYESSMKLRLKDSTFLKYALNAANYGTPTGTISKSLTILWSIYLNGTEMYVLMKGSRAKNVTISCDIGGPIEVTIDWVHMSITTPAASSGVTTPTYATNPTGPAWGWLDGGSNPITYGAGNLDATSISLSVNRNTTPNYVLGQGDPHSTLPHGRRIGGDLTNLWTGATVVNSKSLEGLVKTPETSATTLSWVLKSSTSTLTVTTATFVTYRRENDADATEATIEQVGIKGTAVSVT